MLLRDVEHRCSVSKLVTLYRSQQLPSCALFRVDKVGMHMTISPDGSRHKLFRTRKL